jgi:hypothetical protein
MPKDEEGKTQITRDIDEWSENRFNQWVMDSLARYDMADISSGHAYATMGSLLVFKASGFLAFMTNFTPEECGEILTKSIEQIRKKPRAAGSAHQLLVDREKGNPT